MAKKSDLAPIDWERVEAHYRAGIMSLREIGELCGCSHAAVSQRAKTFGWSRDLKGKIKAKADELLSKQALTGSLSTATPVKEAAIVAAGGAQIAVVTLNQRKWTDKAVDLVTRLMTELEQIMDAPEVFAQVYDALLATGEADLDQMRRLAELVGGLPERAALAGRLVDSLNKAIGGQRRVYGMDEDQKAVEDVDSFENLLDMANDLLGRLK